MVSLLVPCHGRCGTLENPHFSMIICEENKVKISSPHRLWLCLHMSEKFSKGTKNPNKQSNKHHCLTSRLLIFLHPFTMRQSVGLTSMCVFPQCQEIRNVLPRHLYKILIVFNYEIGAVIHIYQQKS